MALPGIPSEGDPAGRRLRSPLQAFFCLTSWVSLTRYIPRTRKSLFVGSVAPRDSHEGIAVGRFSSEVSRSHAQDRTEGERLPGDLWDVQGVSFSIVSP